MKITDTHVWHFKDLGRPLVLVTYYPQNDDGIPGLGCWWRLRWCHRTCPLLMGLHHWWWKHHLASHHLLILHALWTTGRNSTPARRVISINNCESILDFGVIMIVELPIEPILSWADIGRKILESLNLHCKYAKRMILSTHAAHNSRLEIGKRHQRNIRMVFQWFQILDP